MKESMSMGQIQAVGTQSDQSCKGKKNSGAYLDDYDDYVWVCRTMIFDDVSVE